MDNIVNYFVLAFIFVFDPLAVLLLISANKAFALRDDKRNNESKTSHSSDVVEWNEDESDKRMDIIGSNGNDGLHYSGSKEDIYEEKQEEQKSTERKRNAYWT